MRSFLTMLGIIIGVASVIILVSLVNAYMSYMTESFASLGTNQISVNMINLSSRSVSVDEMYEFYEEHTDLFDHMTPMVSVSTTVKHSSDTMSSTSVSGVSEDYLAIKDYDLVQGRNIQYSDITSRQKVCVIGYYVASELYGSPEKAIDETIKIGGYAYRVVGVVERQDEDDLEDGGTDDFVWLPYSCAVKMARNANINNYTFTIIDLTTASEATALIENFLYETFKDDIYISIMNQYTPLKQVEKYPEINRKVTDKEYDEVVDYAIGLGVVNGFIQEGETASESFIPEFDCEGV